SRRRHTRSKRDWSSDVCSSDLEGLLLDGADRLPDVVDGVVHRDDHGHSDGHANSLRLWGADSVGDDAELRDLSALAMKPVKASRSEERRVGEEGSGGCGGAELE